MILKNKLSINYFLVNRFYFSHYKTLNIQPNATDQQIKNSFLLLAKKYHPDNNTQNISQNHKQFIKIKEAYDILKQPNSRKLYDLENFPQKINQQAQNFYFYRAQQFQRNHYNRRYGQKRKSNFLIQSLLAVGLTVFIIKNDYITNLFGAESMHDIRRGNIILANQNIDDGPSVQQRRLKQYSQEIKDKKIYGTVVQLKVKGAGQESTRARQKRLKGIASIEGIQKQKTLNVQQFGKNQQFM